MKGVITMVRSYPIQECFPLKRSCFSRPVLVFRKQDRGAGGPLTSNIPPMLSKRFDFKHLKKNKETYCFGMGEPWGLVQWWLDVLWVAETIDYFSQPHLHPPEPGGKVTCHQLFCWGGAPASPGGTHSGNPWRPAHPRWPWWPPASGPRWPPASCCFWATSPPPAWPHTRWEKTWVVLESTELWSVGSQMPQPMRSWWLVSRIIVSQSLSLRSRGEYQGPKTQIHDTVVVAKM